MENVGYVVLHYQATEETIACIESIKERHGSGKACIIVVDNGSPNHSGIILDKKYRADDEVTVISSHENVGFARGLNIGIEALKEKNTDFYVLLNNDTELASDNWDDVIAGKYEKYAFGVMGPDIVSPDLSRHDNPADKQDTSIDGLERMIREKKREYILYSFYVRPMIKKIKLLIKKILRYSPKHDRPVVLSEDTDNVQLQGSCLILSPRYMTAYGGLFDKTFLYFEEAIVRYRCEQKKIPCMYTPDLVLIHKGSVSVNGIISTERKRKLFYLKHSLHSVLEFRKSLLEKDK